MVCPQESGNDSGVVGFGVVGSGVIGSGVVGLGAENPKKLNFKITYSTALPGRSGGPLQIENRRIWSTVRPSNFRFITYSHRNLGQEVLLPTRNFLL